VKQCAIAVNSVINWSFFLLYLLFFYITKQFIDSESGVTIGLCSQFRIRRLNTWRGDPLEPSICRLYLQTFSRYWPLNVLGSRPFDLSGSLNVTVTWPFDSQVAISYRCSIVTKSLSRAVSEIMGTKHIGVTTLTFLGHLTSSITWPFDSQVAISYRCSIVTKSLSPAVSEILASKCIGVTTLTFQGHLMSSVTWPLDSGWVISYWWSFGPSLYL